VAVTLAGKSGRQKSSVNILPNPNQFSRFGKEMRSFFPKSVQQNMNHRGHREDKGIATDEHRSTQMKREETDKTRITEPRLRPMRFLLLFALHPCSSVAIPLSSRCPLWFIPSERSKVLLRRTWFAEEPILAQPPWFP
jgi:hypothetical protein